MLDLVLKLLIVGCVLLMLKSSKRFQSMSREIDESAMSSLNKLMRAAEESGFPSVIIPVLMLLTALLYMFAIAATMPGGR